MLDPDNVRLAAEVVTRADALIFTAGAGMGVDSGLPDFRGDQGFWKAYPPYAKLGLPFTALANPRWFRDDPAVAWGFYGHRRNLYRATQPHTGFATLLSWAARKTHGAFVFTSNVDGHFQKAGFPADRVMEVHGSVDWMQCTASCGVGIYAAEATEVVIDESTMRAGDPLPACPRCGKLARPNILMFGDYGWEDGRTAEQQARLQAWLQEVGSNRRIAVVECGAGTAVPTVRRFGDRMQWAGAALIRINPREPEVDSEGVGISLPVGALEGIRAIDSAGGYAGGK
jgi:NAD-dependent SIR2 family protein deacetylase